MHESQSAETRDIILRAGTPITQLMTTKPSTLADGTTLIDALQELETWRTAVTLAETADDWLCGKDIATEAETTLPNNGTVGGTFDVTTGPTLDATDEQLEFDGVDDYVDLTVTPSFTSSTGDFSMLWSGLIPSGAPDNGVLIAAMSTASNGIQMRKHTDDKVRVYFGTVGEYALETDTVIENAGLTTVVFTISDGAATLYASDDTEDTVTLGSNPTFGLARVGSHSGSGLLDGQSHTRHVMIFDGTALTSAEANLLIDHCQNGSLRPSA